MSPTVLETRVRREFEELPGVSLTLAQAGKLYGLSSEQCEQVLSSLVSAGLLALTADRRYAIPPKRSQTP